MENLARKDAPNIWEKYSAEFAEHVESEDFYGQYAVFNKFLEELRFLYHPKVSDEYLLEIAVEISNADIKIPARKKAVSIWGKYLLKFSKYERTNNKAKMFRVFWQFVDELKELYEPEISEPDIIRIAEAVVGKPDVGSPEGCMAELLVDDDEYIGVLEPSSDRHEVIADADEDTAEAGLEIMSDAEHPKDEDDSSAPAINEEDTGEDADEDTGGDSGESPETPAGEDGEKEHDSEIIMLEMKEDSMETVVESGEAEPASLNDGPERDENPPEETPEEEDRENSKN